MATRLPTTSAQRRAGLHQDQEGRAYFGSRPLFHLEPHPSDVLHTIAEGDRADLIAYRYLGDPELFWVVLDINRIANPLELPVGQTIRIPAASRLTPEVLKSARTII